MGEGEADAEPGGAFGDGGRADGTDEDVLFFEGVGDGECALVVADDDGDDLAFGLEGVESGLLQMLAELVGALEELGAQVGGLLEEVEGCEGGGELCGGWGGGVDEGAGGLDEVVAE